MCNYSLLISQVARAYPTCLLYSNLHRGATRLHYVAGLPYLPVHTLLAATVAYGPVALALLLCWLGGDRLSWRYVQYPVSK